jgi:hypothetical protein
VPGSERLFAITSLVVLLSVALHGTGIALFLRNEGPTNAPVRLTGAPVTREPDPDAKVPEKITLDEYRKLRDAGKPVVLADVRTDRSYHLDNLKAQGAIRLPPDEAVGKARELDLDRRATIVLYCA